MKRSRGVEFLTVVLFFGILLSFLIHVGLGTLIRQNTEPEERHHFSRVLYEDPLVEALTRYCDYRIFRHSDVEHIMIGRDDWIFEMVDEESGYDYLLDYVGGCAFSEEELAAIAAQIRADRESYAARGIEYLVVVVPNSMTVCQSVVPHYLGAQSDRTRLSQLTAYLEGEDTFFNPFADPSLLPEGEAERMYHNTENALNAYGAFWVYGQIMARMEARGVAPTKRVTAEQVSFLTRMTDGRSAARMAGLERIVENRTVSLDGTLHDGYLVVEQLSGCVVTRTLHQWEEEPTCLLLDLPDDWDRIQLMPFFSNTYDTVAYEQRGGDLDYAVDNHAPTTVIRVIRESELGLLLEEAQ